MNYKTEVLEIRKQRKVSVAKLARITGIDPDRIYKWESGVGNPKSEDSEKLQKWIAGETEVQEPEVSYLSKRRNEKLVKRNRIPYYDTEAIAGITETEMTPIHAPAGTIDIGDLLHDSQAAIRIYGNSMLPNYPPGCVIGLSKCDTSFIEPGEVYVIETRDRRLLKRLFYPKDDIEADKFMCYSDNIMKFDGGARHGRLAYPPFEIPKKDIINLFVVTGVIKRNANSVIINR